MFANMQVGPVLAAQAIGSYPIARSGALQDLIVSELHGRFYELNKSGQLFSLAGAAAATTLAATHATGTLGATATPIVGLWNPPTSGVNLEIIKAFVSLSGYGANNAVSPGGFTWCGSVGNTAISTGAVPYNLRSLTAGATLTKAFANATGALTGLTNNMVLIRGSAISAPTGIQPAAFTVGPACVVEESLDGSLIVPPGGVIALLGNVSTTTVNFNSSILWAESPV